MIDLVVGTRASLLARTQTQTVVDDLSRLLPDHTFTVVHIETEGDTTTTPLSQSANPGVFVSALRDALLAEEVDIIVHSVKDLPAAPFAGISTACIPARADSRDALVANDGHTLATLPPGSRVGTSSTRRAAFIHAHRPDVVIDDIRGNVDSRIAKVRRGDYDATVLAVAGLSRIGRLSEVSDYFDRETFVPAPGQGALSIECRSSDTDLRESLSVLEDWETRLTVTAERAVLVGLRAGCGTPIGSMAHLQNNTLALTAELSSRDRTSSFRVVQSVVCGDDPMSDAHELGLRVAHALRQSPQGREMETL